MAEASAVRLRPGVFRTAGRAWRSTWDALLQMPLAFLITALATVLLSVALSFLGVSRTQALAQAGHPTPTDSGWTAAVVALASLCTLVFQSLTVAPLAIAIHRFVLLGERSPLLPVVPLGRVLRFAGWLIALGVASSIPALLNLVPLPGATLVGFAILIVVTVVLMRLTLLFPAVAVQAPGEPARLGWRETRWQFWRIFAVLFVTGLPALLVGGAILLLVLRFDPAATPQSALQETFSSPLWSVFDVLSVALGAAAASWLFVGYRLAPGAHEGVPAVPE